MLLQVSIENFLSFQARTTFSMLALDDSTATSAQVRQCGGLKVLRCAAIYGANASGKSNFMKALAYANIFVNGLTREKGQPTGTTPFLLDERSAAAPSLFEFHLLAGDVRYAYGFQVTRTAVAREWLDRVTGDVHEPLFSRDSDPAGGSPVIEITGGLTADPGRKQFLEFVAEGTLANRLFLTEAAQHNVTEIAPVYDWFRRGGHFAGMNIDALGFGPLLDDWKGRLAVDAAFRDSVSSYLRMADTGIVGFQVESSTTGFDLEATRAGRVMVAGSADQLRFYQIDSVHMGAGGERVRLPLNSESDGTLRVINLLPVLSNGTAPHDRHIGFIDELDRSLHPLMTRRFVQEFLEDGPANGQLIFTTHDTNLLARELLPAEAVWFVQKDAGGGSRMYSLAEYDPAQLAHLGSNLEAGYLNGRFGAIPFFADRAHLGWSPAEGRPTNGG